MRLRLWIPLVLLLTGCTKRTELSEGLNATSLLNRECDQLNAKSGPFVLALGDLEFNRDVNNPQEGRILITVYPVYQSLSGAGVIQIVTHSDSEKVYVTATEKGKAQYTCSKDVTLPAGRPYLCFAPMRQSVDKIVADEKFDRGGEKYWWIRDLIRIESSDSISRDLWVIIYGTNKNNPVLKCSDVFKLDPFTKQWVFDMDLNECFGIDAPVEKYKAATFFALTR